MTTMIKFVRLALEIAHEGIFEARRASYDRVVDSFASLNFVTEDIRTTSKSVVIKLKLLEDKSFYQILAGEANRFLLASRVSFQRSIQDQNRNAAWQVIELYYAAYFSVHYIIRCMGWGVTNLEKSVVSQVERSLRAASSPPLGSTPTGLYTYEYNSEDKILLLTKKTKQGQGGSHKEAWEMWVKFISSLNERTESDIEEYAKEASALQSHFRFIRLSESRFRPPELRSLINYKFSGNAWEFEKHSFDSIKRFQAILRNKSNLDTEAKGDVERLMLHSQFVVELANAIFIHNADRNRKSISHKLKNQYRHIFEE